MTGYLVEALVQVRNHLIRLSMALEVLAHLLSSCSLDRCDIIDLINADLETIWFLSSPCCGRRLALAIRAIFSVNDVFG